MALPDGSPISRERLAEGRLVLTLLYVLTLTGVDLSQRILEKARERERVEVERQRTLEEIRRRPEKPKARWRVAMWLLDDRVFPLALLALFLIVALAFGACIRGC